MRYGDPAHALIEQFDDLLVASLDRATTPLFFDLIIRVGAAADSRIHRDGVRFVIDESHHPIGFHDTYRDEPRSRAGAARLHDR